MASRTSTPIFRHRNRRSRGRTDGHAGSAFRPCRRIAYRHASATLERAFQSGLFTKVGYSYGASRNTVDAGSIASGSWTGNQIAIDPNNPIAAASQFFPGGRFFAAVSYTHTFLKAAGPTSISVYFDGHSAGTDSYVFSNDMNGDGASGNDLIYVPRNQGEMNFATLTVISPSKVISRSASRNSFRPGCAGHKSDRCPTRRRHSCHWRRHNCRCRRYDHQSTR